MKKKLFFFIVAFSSMMSGCFTRIREHHFFRDNLDGPPNYYKIKVKGGTFLFSKTRYYSGYFNPDAIDIYFNEFTQPKDGRLSNDTTNIHSVDGANADKQLVLIMSSNADAIAEQIGNITQSKNFLNNLISLTSSEKQQRLSDLQSDAGINYSNDDLFFAIGEGLLDNLENKDTTQVRNTLLQLMNQIAADQGNVITFSNWQEAQNWLATFRNTTPTK